MVPEKHPRKLEARQAVYIGRQVVLPLVSQQLSGSLPVCLRATGPDSLLFETQLAFALILLLGALSQSRNDALF